MDIQFLSCDLLQSGGDLLQEYSPLGIHQLMRTTSTNCFSPCRLWDSPSRDYSHEVVLKTVAKIFTCTPSILKKRHRDLLSPLSQNPNDKKHGHVSFLNDENRDVQLQSLSQNGPISNDKENLNPAADVEMAQKEEDISTTYVAKHKQNNVKTEETDNLASSYDEPHTKGNYSRYLLFLLTIRVM